MHPASVGLKKKNLLEGIHKQDAHRRTHNLLVVAQLS